MVAMRLSYNYRSAAGFRGTIQSLITPCPPPLLGCLPPPSVCRRHHTHAPTEKGDALHATELALSLEKLNFQKLRDLHTVAQVRVRALGASSR